MFTPRVAQDGQISSHRSPLRCARHVSEVSLRALRIAGRTWMIWPRRRGYLLVCSSWGRAIAIVGDLWLLVGSRPCVPSARSLLLGRGWRAQPPCGEIRPYGGAHFACGGIGLPPPTSVQRRTAARRISAATARVIRGDPAPTGVQAGGAAAFQWQLAPRAVH